MLEKGAPSRSTVSFWWPSKSWRMNGDELQWIRLIFLFITPFIVGELTKSSTQTSNPNGTSVSQVGYF